MTKKEKLQKHKVDSHIPMYMEISDLDSLIPDVEGFCNMQEVELSIPDRVNLVPDLLEFYSYCNKWSMRWGSWIDANRKCPQEGAFKLVEFEHLISGDVGLDPEEFPKIKNFTILDYYLDENAVGLYLDQPEKGLFYYEMDGDPRPLQLSFAGYVDMLKYTRGFLHWQIQALILAKGGKLEDEKKFNELNELFPDLTTEGFTKLYESLRIDKK